MHLVSVGINIYDFLNIICSVNTQHYLVCFILGPDQHNVANAVFCSWMAVGNILGFSAGASGNWHK